MKEEINKSTITVRDFNITLSIIDRISKPKISKDKEDLKITINHLDLTNNLQNTPLNNRMIHIFSKCTWSIYQNRPYSGP